MDIKSSTVDKLLDILEKAFGRVFKAHYDRQDTNNEAYAMLKLSQAYQEASKLTSGLEYKSENITITPPKELPQSAQQKVLPEPSIEERALSRATLQEIKKQRNLESIVAFAIEDSKDKEPVTDIPVDDDWLTRFFRIAEDVSTEEMQFYWGRILAGEVTRPGSFSLRTLDIFKNISKEEAEVFAKVANLACLIDGDCCLPKLSWEDNLLLEAFDCHYSDIATLIETGLILPTDSTTFEVMPEDKEVFILFKNVAMSVSLDPASFDTEPTSPAAFPIYMFTRSGKQLLGLVNRSTPFKYIEAFAKSIKDENLIALYTTDFVVVDDHLKTHGPLKEFEFDEDIHFGFQGQYLPRPLK